MPKALAIAVSGNTQRDIELALEEVLRLVRKGYLAGVNSNDTGDYSFTSTGEYDKEDTQ